MRFHYLQHADGEDIGNMRGWFEARGWEISCTLLYQGEALPDPDGFDWLGIMGGPMSAYDDALHPWLVEEKHFIRAAIGAGKMVIGICLGSQLLADVLGARVYRAAQQEIGWFEIRRNMDLAHELVSWLPERERFLSWHGDTFELPQGATLLASSDCTRHQGFLWAGMWWRCNSTWRRWREPPRLSMRRNPAACPLRAGSFRTGRSCAVTRPCMSGRGCACTGCWTNCNSWR